MKIGIIGAGFIGRAVARLAVQHGHEVMISNSRHPRTLASTMVAVRCQVGTAQMAAEFGDVVLVAVPFFAARDLAPQPLAGKIVMDANNYYPQRDGNEEALDNHTTTTSEILANHLRGARIVKAFNAILERDIEKDSRPHGAADRRALPIAGDDKEAKRVVSELLDDLGYDVVDAGALAEGWRFERARPAYCVPLDVAGLKQALENAGSSVAEGSWRE
ncbi:NAD(P)-binding domain-containing protein (plasmid) [Paraburkholderia sp. D15]|uniref:NADPH-dependent F420 reductase n=1 Tax=Paraburkholderia sp. D15 TaxID=2880218 RepID=UPI00247A1867|nr:NAD(P)-binding domain-containing protein [Paraburkholderia sp. D15]WGS55276.1 NAD(P)-binding domain-containing protein [Paraburkholderia sp. D15]